MATVNAISAQEARDLFVYDPESGIITRRIASGSRGHQGDVVGSADLHGYRTVRVRKRSYKIHRLAWLLVHGTWPEGDIDHINSNRVDNRLCNLRDVTRAVNLQNQRSAPNNKSTGVLGVYADKGKFYARISIDNKSRHLGTYETVAEASKAYVSAKRLLHPGSTL
jgi:hypothetical protein